MSAQANQNKKNTPKNEKKEVKEPKESKKEKTSEVNIFKSLSGIFKDERFPKIAGVFFILFSVYLLIAFISYLFTWKVDEDRVLNQSVFSLLFDNNYPAENWMGRLGAFFSHVFIKNTFGIACFIMLIDISVIGFKLFLKISIIPVKKTLKYSFFSIIWLSVSLGYLFQSEDLLLLGGIFGFESNLWLCGIFGSIGTALILIFSLISFIIVVFNPSFNFLKKSNENLESLNENTELDEDGNPVFVTNTYNPDLLVVQRKENSKNIDEDYNVSDDIDIVMVEKQEVSKSDELEVSNDELISNEEISNKKREKGDIEFTIETSQNDTNDIFELKFADDNVNEIDNQLINNDKIIENQDDNIQSLSEKLIQEYGEYDPTADLSTFALPSSDLMDDYGNPTTSVQKDELEANKNKIVETLNNYSIQIDKIKATIGPTVTLYEIIPAPGIRISKIKNLEDDIALSLAALGIRIIAPIPGKGTIGIEVPNRKPEIVSMKSVLSSEKFLNCTYELPIALGKTISNDIFIADLTKMPHLLMAGATGQGKSVGLNAILTSILYKKHPSQIKFVLVDPKKVELTLYSKIERHYLAKLPDSDEAIITDTKKVVRTLNSLCVEMDQRYDLLKDAQVRNIKEYNTKFIARRLNPNDGHRYLPYIVLIVDEFADLIMTAGKEVELPIARLAQLARAIGIHLIIATQRPSVNIITGTIKANFPARIAFRVTSKIDSRTILDTGGADQLIGRGDMLLSTGNDLIRLQCAFVDTPEVEKVTDFIGSQRGYSDAFSLPEYFDDNQTEMSSDSEPLEKDPLFEDAARLIVATQQGSTSLLQRKLKLGYNRAGRLIDQLEAAGIVGPFEGSKAREVRIKDEVSLEQILRNHN